MVFAQLFFQFTKEKIVHPQRNSKLQLRRSVLLKMKIANQKKQNNISEYIIFMYQTEDLIRAFEFNTQDIRAYVVKHFPVSEEEKEANIKWYKDIAQQMKEEAIVEKGHLSSVQKYVQELAQLHWDLIKIDPNYRQIYDQAKLHIIQHATEAKGQINNEIQICINGVYGLLLARLKGREVPADTMKSINTFGDVLSYLSYKYRQRQQLNNN